MSDLSRWEYWAYILVFWIVYWVGRVVGRTNYDKEHWISEFICSVFLMILAQGFAEALLKRLEK